jgi:hypothetical protein
MWQGYFFRTTRKGGGTPSKGAGVEVKNVTVSDASGFDFAYVNPRTGFQENGPDVFLMHFVLRSSNARWPACSICNEGHSCDVRWP